MGEILNNVGVWKVETQTSSHIVDHANKQIKRTPKNSNSLNKDEQWVTFVQISYQTGRPMELIINTGDTENPYIYRRTSTVTSVTKIS